MTETNPPIETSPQDNHDHAVASGPFTEYWGFQREGKISCWHKVKWSSREKADVSAADILRSEPTIECISRRKDRPETGKVFG